MGRTLIMYIVALMLFNCGKSPTASTRRGGKPMREGVYISHNHYGNVTISNVRSSAFNFDIALAAEDGLCSSNLIGTARQSGDSFRFRMDSCEVSFKIAADSIVIRDDGCLVGECTYAGTYKYNQEEPG
ncbi:MAG TPA: hypothetical protein VD927_06780 [Chryseosolibacter sp.]|nr:hypothetical protein [Chryseosolibacter sp.]